MLGWQIFCHVVPAILLFVPLLNYLFYFPFFLWENILYVLIYFKQHWTIFRLLTSNPRAEQELKKTAEEEKQTFTLEEIGTTVAGFKTLMYAYMGIMAAISVLGITWKHKDPLQLL